MAKKVAYTPLSEKEKEKRMQEFIRKLKDGTIKAPLPSDLQRPHWRVKEEDELKIASKRKKK